MPLQLMILLILLLSYLISIYVSAWKASIQLIPDVTE